MERKEHAPGPDALSEPLRSSLAVLSVQNKPRTQQSSAAGGFALSRPKRKATGNPDKENGGGLDIFVDDEFKPGSPDSRPASAAPVTGLWTKLGGFEQNRQVILPLQSEAAGTVLKSRCVHDHLAVAGRKMCQKQADGPTSDLCRSLACCTLPCQSWTSLWMRISRTSLHQRTSTPYPK